MKRQAGIELLRGILMLMIVLVHITGNGALLADTPIPHTEPNWVWANIIDAICYPAVNTFILISGFWGIHLKLEKILKLDLPVLFYSVVLFFLLGNFSLGGALFAFFPIFSKEYWFLTSYFLLMLVSPLLNVFIDTLKQREQKMLISVALLFFVLVPTFTPFRLTEARGMDVFNFSVLYLVGRYISVCDYSLTKGKALLLYVVSSILVFSLTILFAYELGVNRGWQSRFYAYNNILVYMQAFGLFFLFKNIQIPDRIGKAINWLAPSFFFVYIISDNPLVRDNLYVWLSSKDYYFSNMFMLHTVLSALGIFVICLMVDVFRRILLQPLIEKLCHTSQDKLDCFINNFKPLNQ